MKYTPAHIRNKVGELLKNLAISRPPIDVELIAEALGVNIVYDDLDDDMSGFLFVQKEIVAIGVNEFHHPNRQRFTIAHELGHFMLHSRNREQDSLFVDRKIFNRNKDASAGVVQEEIEANQFAAELLMPKAMIISALDDEDIDLSDDDVILNLSKLFKVSTQALTYRLISLKLLPPV